MIEKENNFSLYIVLLIAFLLEAAGYLAFPYLGLMLRERFGFQEINIGRILLLGIWIRPFASLFGGFISERLSTLVTFFIACLLEALSFLILARSDASYLAIFAVLLGNIGFAVWSPNLFTIIQKIPIKRTKSSAIALLVTFSNLGGIFGSLGAGIAASGNPETIFLLAASIFILIIPIGWGTFAKNSEYQKDAPIFSELFSWKLIFNHLLLIVATTAFWGTYNQFNVFFSLFIKDSIGLVQWVGFSFGLLACVTALFSFFVSHTSSRPNLLSRVSLVIMLLLAILWIFLTYFRSIPIILIFVVVLGIAEASWATILGALWSSANTKLISIMQSLNFAFRNIGMGLGSLFGGIFYPVGGHKNDFLEWGMQNFAWSVIAALFLYLYLAKSKKQQDENVFN